MNRERVYHVIVLYYNIGFGFKVAYDFKQSDMRNYLIIIKEIKGKNINMKLLQTYLNGLGIKCHVSMANCATLIII